VERHWRCRGMPLSGLPLSTRREKVRFPGAHHRIRRSGVELPAGQKDLSRPRDGPRAAGSVDHSHRSYSTRSGHHGRYKRSTAAKNEFKRQHPCPATGRSSGSCPGYVIDHVNPLECGGADAPYNMQWRTVTEGKAKDKTERNCRLQ
jgi:hypothetical protein